MTRAMIYRHIKRLVNRECNLLSYQRRENVIHSFPEVFQVELTNHCPMTCVMCPRTYGMIRPLGYMDLSVFKKIIDDIAPYTSHIFLHHFGDSLLHPDLEECLSYAQANSVQTYLSANPSLLTARRAEALVDSGLRELVLSMDGATPATNKAIRGPAARDVDDAEAKVRHLLEYRSRKKSRFPKVILQIIKQKLNEHELGTWKQRWSAIEGIDRLKIKRYIEWNGAKTEINALAPNPNMERVTIVCDKPWTSVTILWNGDVVPCCFDSNGDYVLGNVTSTTLHEIWNAAPARRLRETHSSNRTDGLKLCKDCKDREGFPKGNLPYPFNRFLKSVAPLAQEEDIEHL